MPSEILANCDSNVTLRVPGCNKALVKLPADGCEVEVRVPAQCRFGISAVDMQQSQHDAT